MTRLPKLHVLATLTALFIALASAATAQSVVLERINAQSAPGHFTPIVTVTGTIRSQTVRLGDQGLTRAIYFDDDALIAWAEARFKARARIFVEPELLLEDLLPFRN